MDGGGGSGETIQGVAMVPVLRQAAVIFMGVHFIIILVYCTLTFDAFSVL